MNKVATQRIHKVIMIIVVVAALISVALSAYFNLINSNGDSVARLNISRRIVDGTSRGFSQLGYVWLPAPSILMLPTIWMDSWYYSGFAGVILSVIAFLFAAWFIFRIGEVVGGVMTGAVAALLFVLNPNILYAQATPLSETIYLATILGAIYYAILWARTQRDTSLILSGVFFLLATLSRYDAWAMVISTIVAVCGYLYVVSRNWKKVEATAIIFGAIALLGPVLWLIWNYVIFGNPLSFALGEYSAKAQQASMAAGGFLPSQGNIVNAVSQVWYAAGLVSGWTLLIVGIAGIGYALVKIFTEGQLRYVFVLLFGVHILYYIANLFTGNAVILVPQLAPYKLFNVRYALTFLPLFALCAAVVITKSGRRVGTLIAALIFIEYGFMVAGGNIAVLQESVHGFAGSDVHQSRIAAGEWLQKNYDNGYILVDIFDNDVITFYSRVHFDHWVHVGDPDLYGAALDKPEKVVRWVVLRKDDRIAERFSDGVWLERDYTRVWQNEDVKIYKLKPVFDTLSKN